MKVVRIDHSRKENVVVDALNHKHHYNHLMVQPLTSCCDPEEPSLRVIPHCKLNNIPLIPTIKEDDIVMQRMDVGMGYKQRRLELGEVKCFREDIDGVIWFKHCLVVLKDVELHRKIKDEAHCSRYSIHRGTNKMYQDLRSNF
jgi:hypothetical protein